MNKIKVIKTEADYKEALNLIEALMSHSPDPESEDGEKLALLSILVQDYESKAFPSNILNVIDAIKFRMEQSDLKPSDLIPYIGSKSRVSEILSGKRKLTPQMMRALEAGLGIPAKVLLKNPDIDEDSEYDGWDNRLIKEMGKRGYFDKISWKDSNKTELIKNFFNPIGSPATLVGMLRQPSYRTAPLTDKRALAAWSGCVIKKAEKIKTPVKYADGIINLELMSAMSKLSAQDNSPLIVQDYLKRLGIILVIEPHFPKTHLDGAVILTKKDNPIIGLTLRHDRLDNFWFTLMHEMAHIALHFNEGITLFYDEIESVEKFNINTKEKEADELAKEALVPDSKWEKSPAKRVPSPMAAQSLANELGIHIAIIAGIMRHEHKNYSYLNKIISSESVRKYFGEINWNE